MGERTDGTNPAACRVPLVAADLAVYDTTPGGVLYREEFDDAKLRCFVSRYLHTDDRGVRSTFLQSLSSGLWKSVQDGLQQWSDTVDPDAALSTRRQDILAYEFPNRTIRWSAGSEWGRIAEAETAEYATAKTTDTLLAYAGLSVLFPFARWKLFSSARCDLGQNWEQQVSQAADDGGTGDFSYLHVKPQLTLQFAAPDDHWQIAGDAAWSTFFSPPADHLQYDLLVNGSAQARNILLGGHPLSLKVSTGYQNNASTPPPAASGFHANRTDTLTVAGEVTYGTPQIGAVLTYNLTRNDSAEHYSTQQSTGHSAAALVQYTDSDNYIRVGVGGGGTQGDSILLGEAPTTSDTGTANVQTDGQLQLHPAIRLQGSAAVTANRDDGTFQGWYPSWSTALGFVITPPHWTISLSGTYSGQQIDLNKSQTNHTLTNIDEVIYRPTEWIKLSLKGEFTRRAVTGFRAQDFHKQKASGSIAVNLPFWKALWMGPYAGGVWYNYESATLQIEGRTWWAGLFVDISQ